MSFHVRFISADGYYADVGLGPDAVFQVSSLVELVENRLQSDPEVGTHFGRRGGEPRQVEREPLLRRSCATLDRVTRSAAGH